MTLCRKPRQYADPRSEYPDKEVIYVVRQNGCLDDSEDSRFLNLTTASSWMFQNSVEQSTRFWVVVAQDSAVSFAPPTRDIVDSNDLTHPMSVKERVATATTATISKGICHAFTQPPQRLLNPTLPKPADLGERVMQSY